MPTHIVSNQPSALTPAQLFPCCWLIIFIYLMSLKMMIGTTVTVSKLWATFPRVGGRMRERMSER